MNHLIIPSESGNNIAQLQSITLLRYNNLFLGSEALNKEMQESIEKFFACLLLLLFLPILLIVAISIKLFMGGSIFYTQTRVGKDGKLFSIIKIRSMVENAESATGPKLSCKNDPRVTTLGKFLRASHIDEFPQLINVIKGEMSFVGPRPERPEFVDNFENEIVEYKRRREVKPGITGLAQICLPYDATAEQKLEFDVFYIQNQGSILFNLIIVYYTAIKMITFFRN